MTFRELTSPDEMRLCVRLQVATWGPDDATPANQLLISVKTGGHVLGAFLGEELVAFAYGFPAVLPGRAPWLASHMLATRRDLQGQGLGRRLKWLQREWALTHGFDRITWTFDPLEARNAHLNLNVLGATAPEFLPNCYGTMHDKLNFGLPSDRLMAQWDLRSPRVLRALAGRPPARLQIPSRRIAIPPDFQAVKRQDLGKALAIRLEVRARLGSLINEGYEVLAYDRNSSELVLTERGLGSVRSSPSGLPGGNPVPAVG